MTAREVRPWSPSEIAYIQKARATGVRPTEMAGVIGRSRDAICDKLKRLGLSSNQGRGYKEGPWTDAEDAKLDAMVSAGERNMDIARALGRSTGAVALRLANRRRADKAAQVSTWTKDEDERLNAMVAAGDSNADIATALGRSESAVAQRSLYF